MTRHLTTRGRYYAYLRFSSSVQFCFSFGQQNFHHRFISGFLASWPGQNKAQLTGIKTIPGDYATIEAA